MPFVLEKAVVEISATGDITSKLAQEKSKAKAWQAEMGKAFASSVAASLVGGGAFAVARGLAGKASPVTIDRLSQATDDLQAVIGRSFVPAIEKTTGIVRRVADSFNSLSSGQQSALAYGGLAAGAVGVGAAARYGLGRLAGGAAAGAAAGTGAATAAATGAAVSAEVLLLGGAASAAALKAAPSFLARALPYIKGAGLVGLGVGAADLLSGGAISGFVGNLISGKGSGGSYGASGLGAQFTTASNYSRGLSLQALQSPSETVGAGAKNQSWMWESAERFKPGINAAIRGMPVGGRQTTVNVQGG